ncbi:hypothetical protein PMAYCL1PPCAC_11845 [Pristionchus mayeri]|uniref:Uncharacterized protein n=1 Tax=Pristionchus mayeri TaxID=1317129 RepID=A0AAN4ZPZ8_9BILA|nr:hypothetical protein PMAYCL1PPCAC_11845 [Pristionchus mayeri]
MGQHPSILLNHTRSLLERRKFSTLSEDVISLLGNEDEHHSEVRIVKKVLRNQQKARNFLRGVWRRRKKRSKKSKNGIDPEMMRVMRDDLMCQLESLVDSEREEEEEFGRLLFQLMAVGKNSFTLKEISLFVLYAQRRLREIEERLDNQSEEGEEMGEGILDECNQLFYVLSRMEKGSDEDNCYFPSNDVFVDYIFGCRLNLSVKVHLVRNYLLIRMAILQLRAVVRRGSRKREVDEYKEHVKDCLESYSLNALDLPSFHPLRSLPLFLLLEGTKEKTIESFLVKRAKELKFTRVSLRGVSQLEGRDALIRDALEDAWFAYKYPFIKQNCERKDKDKGRIR